MSTATGSVESAPDLPRFGRIKTLARAGEGIALFVLLPAAIAITGNHDLLFPLLWGGMAVCLVWLLLDPTFDRAQLGRFRAAGRELPRIAFNFAVGGLIVLGLAVLLHFVPRLVWPGADASQLAEYAHRLRPFRFPQSNTRLYLTIMVFYPLVSVYPQEVIFRTFFCHRYAPLIRSRWALIIACGLAFAWAHIIFRNWVAVTLCLPGGMLFAWTYLRSRSTVAASVEHALFGDWIFTVGLGTLFYTGAVNA